MPRICHEKLLSEYAFNLDPGVVNNWAGVHISVRRFRLWVIFLGLGSRLGNYRGNMVAGSDLIEIVSHHK